METIWLYINIALFREYVNVGNNLFVLTKIIIEAVSVKVRYTKIHYTYRNVLINYRVFTRVHSRN